ncbi:MAG TPA: lamin tail domain-containing protein [Polyangiaceae bacterium]
MRTNPPLSKLLLSVLLAGGAGACAAGLDGTGAPSSSGDDASAALAPGDDASDEGDDAGFSSSPASWDASVVPVTLDAGGAVHDADASVGQRPPRDAGGDAPCVQALGPGVLVVDEMMIESVAGTGDYGQWIEIASTSSCAVDLSGLHAECPVGSKVRTLDVGEDVWIPPGGRFIIADSTDPAINHYLPGTVLAWDGDPGSVLRKDGGTVSLMANGAIVDSVTWPKLAVVVGASVAFPADCPPAERGDWTRWQTSTASWFPGFYGTPNAPNGDVSCP